MSRTKANKVSAPMAYAWKSNSRYSVPAQVAGEEIARIREERGQFFTAADVVESAREQGSPLHPEFEWNDEAAATEYRKDQARQIINHIVVVNAADCTSEPIRAFVSVRTENDDYRFTTIEHAFSVPILREQILAQALSDMRAFERKYTSFIDLTKVIAAFKVATMKAREIERRAAS